MSTVAGSLRPRLGRRALDRTWSLVVSSPPATAGLVLLLFFLGLAIAGTVMHAQAYDQSLIDRLDSPGTAGHVLGTDTLGRDVLARIMVAVRISLEIGAAAVAIAGTVGVAIGMAAGYFGGWIDDVLMRISDAVLAIPIVLLALSVLAVVGGGMRNLIFVIAFTQWMTYARTARAETLALREQDFVRAARAIGSRSGRILRRHILPEGRQYIYRADWLAIYPGLALLLLVLAINLLGDGLSAYLDPRARRRAAELKPL